MDWKLRKFYGGNNQNAARISGLPLSSTFCFSHFIYNMFFFFLIWWIPIVFVTT